MNFRVEFVSERVTKSRERVLNKQDEGLFRKSIEKHHCKVHNLLQPFEVSNYHLFVISSAKNRNIFQFYSETASLPLTLHVERWHVERWSKDVAYARKAWFPYDRPDRPSRLKKKFSDDRDDHMETLPRRSQTTRTTETTSIAWIKLSFIRTIGAIVSILNRPGRLRSSG